MLRLTEHLTKYTHIPDYLGVQVDNICTFQYLLSNSFFKIWAYLVLLVACAVCCCDKVKEAVTDHQHPNPMSLR